MQALIFFSPSPGLSTKANSRHSPVALRHPPGPWAPDTCTIRWPATYGEACPPSPPASVRDTRIFCVQYPTENPYLEYSASSIQLKIPT
eukprot:1178136-Prorocentrum_minimum.AAC.2